MGAKTLGQPIDNIECTGLNLIMKKLGELESISALAPEYPLWMVTKQMTGRYPEEIK